MRELPATKLVKSTEPLIPGTVEWLVLDTENGTHSGKPLGVVNKNPPDAPSGMRAWRGYLATPTRLVMVITRERTRRAVIASVLEAWCVMQDEIEAYAVLDAIQAGIDGAEELAAEQMALDPHAHLIDGRSANGFPLDATSEALKGIKEYGELIVRRQLNGEEELRIPAVESVTRRRRLIELELERRDRQRTVADFLESSRIEREADENSSFLIKPVDSWLVTELGKAMTNPRRAASLDMATLLLDQVRTLEALALEGERIRPATMMVQIQDDVLQQLAELRARVLLLEQWQSDHDPSWADEKGS